MFRLEASLINIVYELWVVVEVTHQHNVTKSVKLGAFNLLGGVSSSSTVEPVVTEWFVGLAFP